MNRLISIKASAIAAFALLMMAPVTFADDHWSDDWKIVVDGKADSGGSISFKVTFEPNEDGSTRAAAEISALVAEGTSENDTADLIGNAFRAVLGEDDFKIDVSWGENVKIDSKRKTPDFLLELTGNSVQGVSIDIED